MDEIDLSNIVDKEDIFKIEKKLHSDLTGFRVQLISYIKKNQISNI